MTHTVRISKLFTLLAFCAACVNHQEGEITDCDSNRPEITITASTNPTTCDSNDGKIVVAGTAGEEPYQFRINDGAYQAAGTFEGLGGGIYTLTIKDAKGCETSTENTLTVADSGLTATHETTSDTECFSDNGTLSVTAAGKNGPFQYQLGSGAFSTTSSFTGLKSGSYTVTVKDALGCTITVSANVTRGQSGISYNTDIAPIIKNNCAISGCHVAGAQSPNLSVFANVKSNASSIKSRTGDRSMPQGGSLTQQQISTIACWVDDGAPQN